MTITIPYRRLTQADAGNPCLNEVRIHDQRFACVADDGRVRVGSIGEGRLRLDGVFVPDGPRVLANAVARREGTVVIGTHEHRVIQFSDDDGHGSQVVASTLGLGPVNTLEIAANGDVLVGTYSGSLAVVGADGATRSVVDLGFGAIKAIALTPSGRTVVAGTANGTVALVDLVGQTVELLGRHAGIVNDIATSTDGNVVTSVSRDFTVRCTSVADGQVLTEVELPRRSPKSVVDVGDGIVAVGDYWGGLLMVDTVRGTTEHHAIGANGISSLAVAPGGILASSYDGSLTLLGARSGRILDSIHFMIQKPPADPSEKEMQA
jgi:WD40 repeat protein